MLKEILQEIRSKLSPKFFLSWLSLTAVLISFAVYRSRSYELRDSLDFFTFTIGSILPILFPIVSVLVLTISFAADIHHRFLTYTRMRRPIIETLNINFWANLVLTFIFFFCLIISLFIFAYYIEPLLGIANFNPAGYGLTTDNIAEDTYMRHTFTQFLRYGTLTYGIVYALWVGLNAGLFAAIGFVLVLLLRNRYLALSLPFVIYVVGIFTLSALGAEIYRPSYTIFPFDRIQSPIWTALIPFTILSVIVAGSLIYIKRNITKLGNLT
ncbi:MULTISPECIES: ABC transporter permease [Paenibacillus]|uniref:Uncharacterized protein n=1 Tax=Paenibacillus campinasensis TaxID=66347 RepID=A0A268EMR4_9BACL|nr:MULTISPECIES: ABC transporter permease [Paenibacillus]PAD74412.1 hypothetical protein CHH67_17850 [Paenibacillus campinasensis]PAK50809.1 hypothetical protein CHH75_16390 [Paenibacillus sp. 7541]